MQMKTRLEVQNVVIQWLLLYLDTSLQNIEKNLFSKSCFHLCKIKCCGDFNMHIHGGLRLRQRHFILLSVL